MWHGGDIRLISCSTAADGALAAQGLANYLGVNVLAPSDDVYMDFDGNMRIGKNNDGEWRLLKPKNRKEKKQ